MAFKAVIHSPASQVPMQEIHKTIAQFRAEKAAKHLVTSGVTYDTICECLRENST